jgi:hypothetical protein
MSSNWPSIVDVSVFLAWACTGDLTPERRYAKTCTIASFLGDLISWTSATRRRRHLKQASKKDMTKTTRTYYTTYTLQLNYHANTLVLLLPVQMISARTLFAIDDSMQTNGISVREIISW